MSPVRKTSKLNEKNTKQEIWAAYNQLVSRGEKEPELFATEKKSEVAEFLHSLAELKLKLSGNLDKIGDELLKDLNNFQELRNNISKEKREVLDKFQNLQRDLEEEMEKVKKDWQEEIRNKEEKIKLIDQDRDGLRQREEKEYKYSQELARRKENDEFEIKKLKKENELAEEEKALRARKEEIAVMEKKLAEMPKIIEQAVKESNEKLTKELVGKYTIEIRESKLTHQHENKLAEIRIANLQTIINSQSKEIETFKYQLAEAAKQLKEIAVSVIQNKSATGQSTREFGEEIQKKN